MESAITFVQPSSCINPSFWSKLTDIKLNVDKLQENDHQIWGYVSAINNGNIPLSVLEIDSTSYNQDFHSQNQYIPFEGKVINKNTIETFKTIDKMELINSEGNLLKSKIENGDVLSKPSLLNIFLVLTYADLKKYHYYYWFAYPVPKEVTAKTITNYVITEVFSSDMVNKLFDDYRELSDFDKSYFILEKTTGDSLIIHTLSSKLKQLETCEVSKYYFVFYNISNSSDHVGSQLRNFILLILSHCPWLNKSVQKFIALRLSRSNSKVTFETSKIYELEISQASPDISWVGWEKNERDKMGPRFANMKNTLDPKALAENAVDLNLKLMKWRVVPDINLDIIQNQKCLILGSGTLGCSVARCLIGWGVRNITFLDNSTVSYSNPVRQMLFTYEDSVKMKSKALAAAENIQKIFPGIVSKAVDATIPMPGHTIGESLVQQTKGTVDELTKLIKEHDIIFLLMDSRESRWLPTLLGAFYDKIVINAALGFDSYLVLRHGAKSKSSGGSDTPQGGVTLIPGDRLGCYFCNDVTAPGNSTKDRTLDQQCTVTRPGVSFIAGALAVELAISILQHKDGHYAPASLQTVDSEFCPQVDQECQLGIIPHSIRGFLSSFHQILPCTFKYNHCVACSEFVLKEYEEHGWEFLHKVFNSSKHLEDVTQLSAMFEEINYEDVLVLSDNESDEQE